MAKDKLLPYPEAERLTNELSNHSPAQTCRPKAARHDAGPCRRLKPLVRAHQGADRARLYTAQGIHDVGEFDSPREVRLG
jgi:hypothetical protein